MGLPEILLSVTFPILVTVGVGIAVTDASRSEFWIARICFIFAALNAAGLITYWLWPKLGEALSWRLAVGALSAAFLLPTLIFLLHWVDLREARTLRKLIPGNEPFATMPTGLPNGGELPPDTLVVQFGPGRIWAPNLPITILTIGETQILAIERDESNRNLLVKTLRIFDEQEKIIVRIDDDVVWARGDIRVKRSDYLSALTVYDDHDREILNIEFLNAQTLRVMGTFRTPSRPPIIVAPERISAGKASVALRDIILLHAGATAFHMY